MWFFDHFKIGLFIFLFWFVKYFIFYIKFFHRYVIWKYFSKSIIYLIVLLIMSFVLILKAFFFLQFCVGSCHITVQIMHNDTYTPSLPSLPPPPIPSLQVVTECQMCSLCSTETSHQLSVLHLVVCVCWCCLLRSCRSLPPNCVHSPFSTSKSPFLPCKCWREYGENGTLLHCQWKCKLRQPLWRNVWRFLKKLGINLPYDTATPLLGIYSEKTIIQKDTCAPVFIAALFTIARTQKQPRCPLTDEWIRKMWYIYTMEYYSAIKKNEFESVLVRWVNLEPVIQSEVRKRKANIVY